MLYFIPAWYSKDEWKENEQFWHKRRMMTETDDTVKQIQLFQRNSICTYEILLLSYAPNFRHFLHRQSVFRAPYWSVFDAIQEVRRKKQALLSFHSLNWPKNIEFVYTPFTVIAMLNHEKYASIEFGEYGNPIQVDLYRNGQIIRKNIYDDRGFVSCTSVFENGERAYDQYLTDKGVWKLCHFADGHVAVNPRSNQYLICTEEEEKELAFSRQNYGSMEEVIEEVVASWLEITCSDNDIFCVAAHEQHLPLTERLFEDRRTIYSVFRHRISVSKNRMAIQVFAHGNCIVTDSEDNLETLRRQSGLEKVLKVNIPPYDTRTDPGISQRLRVQKILFPVDNLKTETLKTAVKYLAAYLDENRNARVHLFTRSVDYGREEVLLGQVREALQDSDYPPEWARKDNTNQFEVLLDEEEQMPILFVVEQCVDEPSANKCIREQRVVVDLADTPDLFLQISCISMGIPQILKTTNQYMRNGKNGRVNRDLAELGMDLRYYLESIHNWNEAMIQSFELGKAHTTEYLIERWKEVIEGVGNGTSIAAGN